MFYDLYLELCLKKNVSPTRAALEIGVSKSTPTTWKKRGLTPQGETLSKIANYFDVTTDYLLTGEDTENAPTRKGEREGGIEQAKIALFGGDGEVTDEMWDEALFAAQLIKERYKRKKD